MKSQRGTASIGRIDDEGLELFANGERFFLPFEDFAWFRGAPERMIRGVQIRFGQFLHWRDLDVDLELESLRNPAAFPLRFDPNPEFAKWVAGRDA